MRQLLLILLLLFFASTSIASNRAFTKSGKSSESEARNALIIGNSNYQTAPLRNPVNDARDMASVLRKKGFQVTLLTDANQRKMKKAISLFGKKLMKGGIGLFFYAGHGMQVKGVNYLIPIGATIEDENDIEFESIEANRILSKMESAGNKLNVVFLDACRNNPFARSFRSGDKGLATMNAPSGSLLAFATAPGKTAADGVGKNGLFTSHILREMQKPGLELTQMMKRVRKKVREESGGKQIPWDVSSLEGDFYFSGQTKTTLVASATAVTESPEEGGISIKSEPTKAKIYVNDVLEGNSPLLLDFSPGVYTIIAKKRGYRAEKESVRVRKGKRIDLTFILDKSGGSIWIKSDPENAKIYLNGTYYGETPYTIKGLSDSYYDVKLEKQGYFSKKTSIKMIKNEENELNLVLQKKSKITVPQSDTISKILSRGELIIGLEAGYMPFEMRNNKGHIIGLDIDIAKLMAKSMGVKLMVVNTNWDGIIPALLAKKFDILLSGMTITTSRALKVNFTDPYFIAGQTILLNKRLKNEVKSYKDLNRSSYTIASKLGTTGEQAVKRMIPRARYISYETEQEGAMEVISGNVDAFVYDLSFNAIMHADKGSGRIIHLEKPFTYEPFGIAIRKGDRDFLNWLNLFLKQIKNDGTFDKIYTKWFRSADWKRDLQ